MAVFCTSLVGAGEDQKVKLNKVIAMLAKSVQLKIHFFFISTKTYVVGTQKNRLNERVLLSTENTCLN